MHIYHNDFWQYSKNTADKKCRYVHFYIFSFSTGQRHLKIQGHATSSAVVLHCISWRLGTVNCPM